MQTPYKMALSLITSAKESESAEFTHSHFEGKPYRRFRGEKKLLEGRDKKLLRVFEIAGIEDEKVFAADSGDERSQ